MVERRTMRRGRRCSAWIAEPYGLAEGFDGDAFLQKLQARGDDFVAGLETGEDRAGVAYGFAEGDGDLMGGVSIAVMCRDEDERLAADKVDCKDGYYWRWRGAPGDARIDKLLVAQELGSARDFSFGENALQAVVNLGGDEADGEFGEDLAVGVDDLHRKTDADLSHALGWDVDVGFEVGVLIDGG